MDNGDKYKFDNPRKNRKGKPRQSDWLKNEKTEGKLVLVSRGKKYQLVKNKISGSQTVLINRPPS